MTAPVAAAGPSLPAGPQAGRSAQLEKTARQLEGVFVLQMLKAMRTTVPKGGITDANTGEEMFTSMFDEKIADQVPAQWKHGLTDALVKQLAGRDAPSRTTGRPAVPTIPAPEPLR